MYPILSLSWKCLHFQEISSHSWGDMERIYEIDARLVMEAELLQKWEMSQQVIIRLKEA